MFLYLKIGQIFYLFQTTKETLSIFYQISCYVQKVKKLLLLEEGFFNESDVSCNTDIDLNGLKADHEEADTRMILHIYHCKDVSDCETIAVLSKDTDVLVLLFIIFLIYNATFV